MPRVLGISSAFRILDETCLIVWIGDDGYPTFGPNSRYAAIEHGQLAAMAARSVATDDDWARVINTACAAAEQDEAKPDVYLIDYDPRRLAKAPQAPN